MSRNVAIATTMFLAAGAWAQSPAPAPAHPAPVTAPDPASTTRVTNRFGRGRNARAPQVQAAPRDRVQETENTLNAMHSLLKEMQAKNAASRSKDPAAKANLEMWELLLGHLDKEFHLLQAATAAREDLEARRASLYKQAYSKAAAEAAAAGQSAPAPSTPATPKPEPKE